MSVTGLATPSSEAGLPPDAVIFGSTLQMEAIRDNLLKIAETNIPVLIEGESGTGKEIIAKFIHQRSHWAPGPFVKVSCPSASGTLVQSELFGYGEATSAGTIGAIPGRAEMADCGTLFLDEISELDVSLQSKLLELLQDGQFCPVNARDGKRIDIRVVCATNRVLDREVAAGRFRQDLYYRITGVVLRLPALRQRVADIPQIADYLIRVYSQRYQRNAGPLSPGTRALLQAHQWPGNIRELENLCKRYVIFGTEDVITSEMITRTSQRAEPNFVEGKSISLKQVTRNATKNLENKIILSALQATKWNRKQAARNLKISYRALLYKMKKAGLDGNNHASNGSGQNLIDLDPQR